MYFVEIPLGEIATGLHLWSDLVLVELRKAPQPERSTFVGNCDHIVKITRAQAAADCQPKVIYGTCCPVSRIIRSIASRSCSLGTSPQVCHPK
jgi:hypothetical protein